MKKSKKTIINQIPSFLEYCEVGKGLSNLTIENYTRFLLPFQKWLKKNNLMSLLPHDLTTKHIWDYRLYLAHYINPNLKSHLQKTTQNYYLIVLRGLLSYFAEKDISSLPPEKIKLAKDKKGKAIKFLNLDQIEKLLLAPNIKDFIGLRDRAILEVLFSTGLRVAELISLETDMINLEILNKNRNKGLELAIVGKGKQTRTVYLSTRAINSLINYLQERSDDDPALFINAMQHKKSSKRLSIRAIEMMIKKYCQLTGLPSTTTPHTIRHSYATDLLEQGVDLRTIQEFLGHRNIITTQIYTHVTNKHLRDVHRAFHSGKNLKD